MKMKSEALLFRNLTYLVNCTVCSRGDADGLVGNSNVERQGQYRHQLLARQDGTLRGAEGLVNNGSVGPQGQHRQQLQVRQEQDGRKGAEGLIDISTARSQGQHRQQKLLPAAVSATSSTPPAFPRRSGDGDTGGG